MTEKGWYSGDSHIHLTRDEVADPTVWGMSAAEDVHVGNLLEMGNIAVTHFKQPEQWGEASRYSLNGRHYVVTGQEDPRTGQLGHTIHLNLKSPLHASSDEYFFYKQLFQAAFDQGALSGFAHAGVGFNGPRGAALTVPFGLVNFLEVMQGGRVNDETWYRFLNMGYRINPAAGSDWPYTDLPGGVRHYVKVDGAFDVDKWFASMKAGNLFVTNGPFLEFSINGQPMGSELRVKRGTTLNITASAQLNPDVDQLDRIELIVLGDVSNSTSANGTDRVEFRQQLKAERSMWIAIRARGERTVPGFGPSDAQAERPLAVAHTAPIYVIVDDEPSWKAEAVPELVAFQRNKLREILTEPIVPSQDLEAWETRDLLLSGWAKQQPLLKPSVDEADALYMELLAAWQKRYPNRQTQN
jgi:hypothetical protein